MKQITFNSKYKDQVALVDDEDYEKIKALGPWHLRKKRGTFYAQRNLFRNGKRTTQPMHRVLFPEWPIIDHIDGNGLNNQKSNLRLATNQENSGNSRKWVKTSSKYKGVSWRKDFKKWRAVISINKKKITLGHFDNEEDAGRAYNEAAKKNFGKFAYLNVL